MRDTRYILFLLAVMTVYSAGYLTVKVKDFNVTAIKKYSFEFDNCLIFRGIVNNYLVISYCNGTLTFYYPPIIIEGICRYKLIDFDFERLLEDIVNGTFKNYDEFSNDTIEYEGCKINKEGIAECPYSVGNKTLEAFKEYFERYKLINCTKDNIIFENITFEDIERDLKKMKEIGLIKDYEVGNYTPKIFFVYPDVIPFSEKKGSFVIVIRERPKEEEKTVNEEYIKRIREERKKRLLIRKIKAVIPIIAPFALVGVIGLLWWKKWRVK